MTSDASDYGLGVASDLGLGGGMDDTGVRRGITEAEAQARLSELAASRAAREPKTVVPTQCRLTTCYCMRWGQMHYGLDMAAPLGTPIYSAVDGVVLRAGRASGFGNAVYIQDADGRRPHLRPHALLRRRGRRHRPRGRRDRQGRQRGLLDRPAPALGDPPRRHERAPDRPQDWLAERGVD